MHTRILIKSLFALLFFPVIVAAQVDNPAPAPTSIVGITGTKSEFNAAVTDGNFLYVGDVTQYTDEMAQDAVGGMCVDTAEIDITYNDALPSLTASLVLGSIDETKLDTSVNASLDLADSSLQSEADTLGTVTGRGASTATESTFSGGIVANQIKANSSAGLAFKSSSNTAIAEFGAGGGGNATFEDGVKLNAGTASRALATDANKNIAYSATTATELGYLSGVTSAVQTQLDGKVDENSAIVGATKTKVTYDTKGLVTAGADATTADIADSLNRRYVTDAQQTVISNTSGTNSGDVTLSGTPDYITITGQAITRGLIDLATDITGDLPFANFTQGSALSVLGVTGNATADVASIAAGSDHQVLRRSGTSVGFGQVNLASSNAITGVLPVANGGTGLTDATIAFGTYTPTATNESNLGTISVYSAQYLRVGNIVNVSGKVDIDATTTATETAFRLTLPIASNFTSAAFTELSGTINAQNPSAAGIVRADPTNDAASVRIVVNTASNHATHFIFTYRIL